MNNYRDRTCKALATYFTVEFAAFCLASICTFANLHLPLQVYVRGKRQLFCSLE